MHYHRCSPHAAACDRCRLYASIPEADRTIALRHVIAHGYDVIVDEIVWEIIQEKIPVLLKVAQRLFNS